MNKSRLILLVAATSLQPFFSIGQDVSSDKKMHHESIGDPYLPNAHNNEKVSPAYKFNVSTESKMTTTIFTAQANVNSNQQNIIGDAANEPSIAVNPLDENSVVIGWRQFDNVISNFRQAGWSYTSDGGQTWTFPGVIEPGIFRSDPVLDYDSAGNFYYNSLTSGFFCKVFKSIDGGAVWDDGVDAAGGDKQWMTIDRTTGEGSGNIYSFWTSDYSTCLPGQFTRSTDAGSSFEACIEVDGDPWWGTMAVGNDGELYIAGANDQTVDLVVAKSIDAQTAGSPVTWNNPVYVFMDGQITYGGINPEGIVGQVSIDIDRSDGPGKGNVYILASLERLTNSDPADVMFAKSSDDGLNWSSPIRINDDASTDNIQWFGTMSVAPNGRVDAIWLDTRDALPGAHESALYYSYSIDGGDTWSVNEKLSKTFDPHVGYPNQSKMGDYFDMVSDNTGAHLSWAATFNGEEDVYYSRIIPEINTGVEGVPDNTSIAVYPNPTNGKLTISNSDADPFIEVYNLMGEKIYSTTLTKTKYELDISSQPNGVYYLRIVGKNGEFVVEKIVKE